MYKLNEKDALFAISQENENSTSTFKSPFFDEKKESNNSLRCVTYAMDYSNIFCGNITDGKTLSQGSWALRITSYVTNHSTIWNSWLQEQTFDEKHNSFKMIIGDSSNN